MSKFDSHLSGPREIPFPRHKPVPNARPMLAKQSVMMKCRDSRHFQLSSLASVPARPAAARLARYELYESLDQTALDAEKPAFL